MKSIKGKKLQRTLAAALAAAMLLPIAGCTGDDTPDNTASGDNNSGTPEVTSVRVGYTTLQSGAMAAVGPLIDTCVNIAKEDFEATHDVKIDLVIEDAGSTVESAIDATVRLIDDGVSCIIGIVGSNQYAGMLEELEDARIPMMTTVAPDEIFTRGYDWLFNSYVTRQQENAPMLKWAESWAPRVWLACWVLTMTAAV